MKNKINTHQWIKGALIVCFAFLSNAAAAQFQFGLTAGLPIPAMLSRGADPFTNQSVRIPDYDYGYTSTPFFVGLWAGYDFKEESRSGLRSDLYYANNGLKVTKRITYPGLVSTPTDITISSPEILLDLLYKYTFPNSKWSLFAGPYVSVMLDNVLTTRTKLDFPDLNLEAYPVQKATLRKFDSGITLSVQRAIGKHLTINFKANFGLVDMIPPSVLLKITDQSLREVTPAFARAAYSSAGNREREEKLYSISRLSDQNGKYLRDLDLYRIFTQIGVSWGF